MRQEIQLKTRHVVTPEELLDLGAEWIGNTEGVNHYLGGATPGTLHSVRIEGNTYHYTQKGKDHGQLARIRDVTDRQIDPSEAKRLMKKHGVVEKVEVSSHLFALNGGVVSLDEVAGLGSFVEIRGVSNEAELQHILDILGISGQECTKESYFELMHTARLPRWKRWIIRFHKQVTEATFGFTSGTMTTSGMMAGMFIASPKRSVVAVAIILLGVADSFSESFGMYNSKLSEGMSRRNALRHALWTAAGNVVVPALYLWPIFVMPNLRLAIILDLFLGASLLLGMSAVRSIANLEKPLKPAMQSLVIGAIIVVLTAMSGKLEVLFR